MDNNYKRNDSSGRTTAVDIPIYRTLLPDVPIINNTQNQTPKVPKYKSTTAFIVEEVEIELEQGILIVGLDGYQLLEKICNSYEAELKPSLDNLNEIDRYWLIIGCCENYEEADKISRISLLESPPEIIIYTNNPHMDLSRYSNDGTLIMDQDNIYGIIKRLFEHEDPRKKPVSIDEYFNIE